MKTKTIALKKILTTEMAYFAIFFSAVLFAPLIGVQAITGPIVNAILFLAVIFIGVRGAVLIALFPSIIALSVGLLPPAIAPMIPFIISGNVILVVVFNHFYKSFWKGVFLASYLKFLFLSLSSLVVVNFLTNEIIAKQMLVMMSCPQLITALAGGVIAHAVLRFTQKTNKSSL